MKIYPFFLLNYEIVFFLACSIGFGSTTCRHLWVYGGVDRFNNKSKFVAQDDFANPLFSKNEKNTVEWIRESVSFINDKTLCSSNHYNF